MSAFILSAKSESGLDIMPGLGAGDLLPFRLLPRSLDVELRTVRDFGLVAPASALMFDGERGRSGETAMFVSAERKGRSTIVRRKK